MTVPPDTAPTAAEIEARAKAYRLAAARFHFKNIPGYVADWSDSGDNPAEWVFHVDQDIVDLAGLLRKREDGLRVELDGAYSAGSAAAELAIEARAACATAERERDEARGLLREASFHLILPKEADLSEEAMVRSLRERVEAALAGKEGA